MAQHKKLVVIALAAPFFATAVSAALRGQWQSSDFDAPARFLLAIPIFVVISRVSFDADKVLRAVLPLALIFTATQLKPLNWGEMRTATYFTDPLVVGYVSVAFAMMCLASLQPRCLLRPDWDAYSKLTGVVVGLYVSVETGSRTGWLAVPLVLAGWVFLQVGPDHRRRGLRLALIVPLILSVTAYSLSGAIQARVNEAVFLAHSYVWEGLAPVNSIAARITFLRIGADMLAMYPFAGVGDTTRLPPVDSNLFPYATRDVVRTAFESGLHNQILSNGVRLGVGGIVATGLLLLVPLFVCARRLTAPDFVIAKNAALGTAYGMTLLVSSLSTEVVDLKYAASLSAALIAVVCGSILGPDKAQR